MITGEDAKELRFILNDIITNCEKIKSHLDFPQTFGDEATADAIVKIDGLIEEVFFKYRPMVMP